MDETKASGKRKLKVLCFHGYNISKEIFEY